MFKNIWFQTHWLLGITAGLVLALVGVTGALLSFEDDIIRLLNPGVVTLESDERPGLAAPELLAAVRAANPGRQVTALTLYADPGLAPQATFAPAPGPDGQPAQGRGERRHVDPVSGALLSEEPLRGEAFLREVMRLHRWLVVGELGDQAVGKQVVGISTLALVVLAASGLYLRWPRRALSWRSWLALDWRLKGRSFLWDLHSVVGTWILLPYLVMALTGLTWSYDWYRAGFYAAFGVEQPARRGPPGMAPSNQAGEGGERDAPTPEPFDLAPLWATFQAEVPAWSQVSFRIPDRPGGHVDFRYLDPEPPHERAGNELEVDAASAAVLGHSRYADKALNEQIVASIFPLHSGSYFGTAGLVVFCIASLLMPLFAITGWLLYLNRRGRKKQARAAAAVLSSAASGPGEPLLIGFASQTGTAERLAWQSAAMLRTAGIAVQVAPLASLDAGRLARHSRALFVASTFGEGEPPDGARAFLRRVMGDEGGARLAGLSYGLLALGNRQYRDFCGFGRALDSWLRQQGAAPLFDRVEADEGDAGALRHWQRHLTLLGGLDELPEWQPPALSRWRLAERRLLNPQSLGGPCYHIELEPLDPADLDWEAGDVAEIRPCHGSGAVEAFLAASGLDGRAPVPAPGGEEEIPLASLLARSILPTPAEASGRDAKVLAAILKPLPEREYSIASLPGDGRLHLLVRQMRGPGGLGLGSGWLTHHAEPGADIRLGLRANPNFRAPDPWRPMILIGNGTGIAGLRAHIKARAAAGARDNWLLFGERSRARDGFYGAEIEAWRESGHLSRVDFAFSRDQQQRVYVQQRLAEAGDLLRHWIDRGAAIYVCGSLEGMAPGVEAVLVEQLGAERLEGLAAEGRYRRDVY